MEISVVDQETENSESVGFQSCSEVYPKSCQAFFFLSDFFGCWLILKVLVQNRSFADTQRHEK
ncbi:hypothetical protein HAX54_030009, partial [Datura stramonium]|nr:hypothetical protein [Datura stramonium]